MSNPRRKGQTFEREISKKLSSILDYPVRRVPQSGAYATRNKQDLSPHEAETLTGDLILPPNYPYIIECKHYKSFAWHLPEYHLLDKWWGQAEAAGNLTKKIPLIIFKIDRQGTWVVGYKSVIPTHLDHSIEYKHLRIVRFDILPKSFWTI